MFISTISPYLNDDVIEFQDFSVTIFCNNTLGALPWCKLYGLKKAHLVLYIFWRARVCKPVLCLCCYILTYCHPSPSFLATRLHRGCTLHIYQLTHPPYLATPLNYSGWRFRKIISRYCPFSSRICSLVQ
jgi:hypothetical protein